MPEKTELCPSDQVLCMIAGETRLQCALWPHGLMARDLGPALLEAPEQRAEICAFQFSPGERVLMQSTSGELQARAQNNLSREILTLDRSHFVAETFALPFCSFFFFKGCTFKSVPGNGGPHALLLLRMQPGGFASDRSPSPPQHFILSQTRKFPSWSPPPQTQGLIYNAANFPSDKQGPCNCHI